MTHRLSCPPHLIPFMCSITDKWGFAIFALKPRLHELTWVCRPQSPQWVYVGFPVLCCLSFAPSQLGLGPAHKLTSLNRTDDFFCALPTVMMQKLPIRHRHWTCFISCTHTKHANEIQWYVYEMNNLWAVFWTTQTCACLQSSPDTSTILKCQSRMCSLRWLGDTFEVNTFVLNRICWVLLIVIVLHLWTGLCFTASVHVFVSLRNEELNQFPIVLVLIGVTCGLEHLPTDLRRETWYTLGYSAVNGKARIDKK